MTKTEEKSIRVIEFTGEARDWIYWSKKFLARANMRGYKAILLGTDKQPTKAAFEAAKQKSAPDQDEKKVIELYELAQKAYDELVLSINTQEDGG